MQETITRRAARPGTGRAWTGVLLGAVGLFILNVVFGPVAIGLGIISLRRGAGVRGAGVRGAGARAAGQAGYRAGDRAAGIASIVLGVADLAVLAVLIGTSLGHGGLVWHFGS
jgi:hypothetical protein